MALSYFPFDAGAGANVTEDQWSLMAQLWLGTGVIKNDASGELIVTANSSGMQVFVAAGKAWLRGHYFSSDASVTLPIASNASGNPRIDRIIVELDKVNNIVNLRVLQGTPAASPVAPALTQTTNLWQISLAQVAVANGAANIASGNVTDERTYATSSTDRVEFAAAGAGATPDTFIRRGASGGITVVGPSGVAQLAAGFGATGATGGYFSVTTDAGANVYMDAKHGTAADANVIMRPKGNGGFYVQNTAATVTPLNVDTTATDQVNVTHLNLTGYVVGSPSGYNVEIRLGNTNAGQSCAISTQSTGAPEMAFHHRGTSNTGTWSFKNGTNGSTTVLQILTDRVNFNNAVTGTTSPAAGGAGALPATPAGYLTIQVGGGNRQIPYY